jgi:putative transposase
MHFEKDFIYHIYNQGNNKQKIFFNRDNYLFFLRKIKIHILPFADILDWCLMPNHFHLMVLVNEVELEIPFGGNDSGGATWSRTPTIIPTTNAPCSLQKSIGILLASYTRAINKQNDSSGSLFRSKTKAECLNQINGITPSFYNTPSGTIIHVDNPEKQYPNICFNYIHQNPVNAHLVKSETDWEYSSAMDYAGLRNETLVNQEKAKEYFSIENGRAT